MLRCLKNHVVNIKNKDMKTGLQVIENGPLSQEGRKHGKGSSSGAKGMKLKLMQPCGCVGDCGCNGSSPITQRVKASM